MKRFITEYANYKMQKYKNNELMDNTIKAERIKNINRATCLVEKGMITVDEALLIIMGKIN